MTEPDVAELFRKVDEVLRLLAKLHVDGVTPSVSSRLSLREIARAWPAEKVGFAYTYDVRRAILKALGEKP